MRRKDEQTQGWDSGRAARHGGDNGERFSSEDALVAKAVSRSEPRGRFHPAGLREGEREERGGREGGCFSEEQRILTSRAVGQ